MEMSWADYWWNRVTGPHEVVLAVADALSEGHSVSLRIPGDLPWRHEMRAAVRDALLSSYGLGDVTITTIDGDDLPPEAESPGNYLLERFALVSDRRSYRPRPDKTIQSFIIDRKVLKNRIVWIKGVSESIGEAWLSFCEGYQSTSVDDGLFIIEMASDRYFRGIANVQEVALKDHISVFDARLLNSIMIGDGMSELADARKRYYTALVTHLCGTDVEVAEELISQPDFSKLDIRQLIQRVAEMPVFSRRGSQSEDHILSLCRSRRDDLIARRIWEAQTESLYPLVEAERLLVITELKDGIDNLIQSPGIMQFEERVQDARDVELGTLVYLMASRQLYVPEATLRDRIHLLRECRNLIAHNECCSIDQVDNLLGG